LNLNNTSALLNFDYSSMFDNNNNNKANYMGGGLAGGDQYDIAIN
jgi:hypothetical protein